MSAVLKASSPASDDSTMKYLIATLEPCHTPR